MIRKILIANRGEIACRIIKACKEMKIGTVAVYSDVDSDSPHVLMADEAIEIGPANPSESYLNFDKIVNAAKDTNSDAIHPGYGFLSENGEFAKYVSESGLIFIGPDSDTIKSMGDKAESKQMMMEAGVPTIPGSDGELTGNIDAMAREIGYPLMVKAAAGGGGKGMKVAHVREQLGTELALARREAMENFGNDEVYIEKYLSGPRHIELQIMADNFGNVVHFGERDCSIQRRHQKVLEEAPSPILSADERDVLFNRSIKALTQLGYLGAGTLEYLFEDGEFYFIEMNTRIQVEHPVTEMVTGVDLVCEQIRVAAGSELSYNQEDIHFRGHAIECRINAESPETFIPTPGTVTEYHPPGGGGVRVDSALYSGYRVPPFYDSMVGKLIVHGATREECIERLSGSLKEFVIEGIETTIPLHQSLLQEKQFADGSYDIHW